MLSGSQTYTFGDNPTIRSGGTMGTLSLERKLRGIDENLIRQIFNDIDLNKTGQISSEEFKKFLPKMYQKMNIKLPVTDEVSDKVFSALDGKLPV